MDEGIRLPYLRVWTRTRSAIVLHLSNGTMQVRYFSPKLFLSPSWSIDKQLVFFLVLQINFFHDHTKVVICPLMQAVSYIDENKMFRTFRLKMIEQYGCSKELVSRLRYAK